MEGYQQAFRTLLENKQVAAVVRKQPLAFLQELCSRKDAFVVDLDDPFGKIGCVIMASGLGRRFGSNKLLADFGGEPMICRILDATEGIFRRRVVVTRHEEIARLCREREISVALHCFPTATTQCGWVCRGWRKWTAVCLHRQINRCCAGRR